MKTITCFARYRVATAALWLAAAVGASLSCRSAQGQAPGAAKPPIKVGAISSVALFPEATAAVKAYFDAVNAAGGIQGRRLVLIAEDDHADPAQAARAARKLAEAEQVVAHVGSASVLECAVNAAYYVQQGLVSIQGTGVDPVCFDSPNIAPVNSGPYLGTVLGLQFLADVKGRDRLCAVAVAYAPIQKAAFEREVAAWAQRSGRRLAYAALGIEPAEPLGPHIERATQAGCQGLVFTAVGAAVSAWIQAAKAQRKTGIDWVFLTPAYTAEMAQTMAKDGEGIYAMSEFEPWSSRSGVLSDWKKVMTGGGVPLTSLSQGGYAAAFAFVKVLRGIRGEITRTSVTQAFKQMEPQRIALMGTPYAFGPGARHNPNRAAVPVQLQAGRWVIAHWDYIVASEAK